MKTSISQLFIVFRQTFFHHPSIMLITLLTDFGTADYFVGAMKGAILSVNPSAQIVDLTHEIPPHDIEAAAFTLLACYKTFPPATIHLGVVDPGVGSVRRPLLISAGGQFFTGPDNGIFSYICEREEGYSLFHLDRTKFFRKPVSTTFHGRDVFAPVAGALSKGLSPDELGRVVGECVHLAPLEPHVLESGELEGRIIHVDRFGNCVTNLTETHLTAEMLKNGARLSVNETEIKSFRRFFAEASGSAGELFVIPGSAGFLEIAADRSSAAMLLGVERGQSIILIGAGKSSGSEG